MKNVNPVTRRVVGGLSFTDSIIRTNADTVNYVKYVLNIINKYVLKTELKLYLSSYEQILFFMLNDELLLSVSKEKVEALRQQEVLAFDKFIIQKIKDENYEVLESSDYFKNVFRAIS